MTHKLSHQQSEPQTKKMDQYTEFCRLRDYRKPGAEVPQYTEAEAFALAVRTDSKNRKKKCFAT